MAKTSGSRETRDIHALLKAARGEALPYRQIFEAIAQVIPLTEAAIVTTLPRGSLQIAQPQRIPDSFLRSYAREFHAMDRPTWQVIARGRPLRARECWPAAAEFETSRYFQEFLQPHGFRFQVAAPLSAPVLAGYPGAVHLYRAADQGAFHDSDLQRLAQIARDLDDAILRTRQSRKQTPVACAPAAAGHHAPVRQFIFDAGPRLVLPKETPAGIDERLMHNIVEHARFRLGHVNGEQMTSDRVSLPDARGDLWNFRVVGHRTYPALGEGPFVFFCVQPPCGDWGALRPADFGADAELARLIPAMEFMRENFHRGPTLNEIARIVHLSPFHFHRRFTELLGITPKHFLLDCQIERAKCALLAREKDLAQIASECGFAHQSHFTSRFKQATGATPTRWRKMASERAASASVN